MCLRHSPPGAARHIPGAQTGEIRLLDPRADGGRTTEVALASYPVYDGLGWVRTRVGDVDGDGAEDIYFVRGEQLFLGQGGSPFLDPVSQVLGGLEHLDDDEVIDQIVIVPRSPQGSFATVLWRGPLLLEAGSEVEVRSVGDDPHFRSTLERGGTRMLLLVRPTGPSGSGLQDNILVTSPLTLDPLPLDPVTWEELEGGAHMVRRPHCPKPV